MPFKKGQSGCPSKKFTKENQPKHNRSGIQKKSLLNQIKDKIGEEIGVIPRIDDVEKIMWMLASKNHAELKEIATSKTVPFFMKIIANAFYGDYIQYGMNNFDKCLDRIKGKPAQTTTVKQETINHNFDYEKLSDTELESLQKILQKADTGE